MKRIIFFLIIFLISMYCFSEYPRRIIPQNPQAKTTEAIKSYKKQFKENELEIAEAKGSLESYSKRLENMHPKSFFPLSDQVDQDFIKKDILIRRIADLQTMDANNKLIDIISNETNLYWMYHEIRLLNSCILKYINTNNHISSSYMIRYTDMVMGIMKMDDILWNTPVSCVIPHFHSRGDYIMGPYLIQETFVIYNIYSNTSQDGDKEILLDYIESIIKDEKTSSRIKYYLILIKVKLGIRDLEALNSMKNDFTPSNKGYELGRALFKKAFPEIHFNKENPALKDINRGSNEAKRLHGNLTLISNRLESHYQRYGSYPLTMDEIKDYILNTQSKLPRDDLFTDYLSPGKDTLNYTSDGNSYLLKSSVCDVIENPYVASAYMKKSLNIPREEDPETRKMKNYKTIENLLMDKRNEIWIKMNTGEDKNKKIKEDRKIYLSAINHVNKVRMALEAYRIINGKYPTKVEDLHSGDRDYYFDPFLNSGKKKRRPESLYDSIMFDPYRFQLEDIHLSRDASMQYITDEKGKNFVLLCGFLADDFLLLEIYGMNAKESKNPNQAIISTSFDQKNLIINDQTTLDAVKGYLSKNAITK